MEIVQVTIIAFAHFFPFPLIRWRSFRHFASELKRLSPSSFGPSCRSCPLCFSGSCLLGKKEGVFEI